MGRPLPRSLSEGRRKYADRPSRTHTTASNPRLHALRRQPREDDHGISQTLSLGVPVFSPVYSFEMVAKPFVTQMLAPSKATPTGPVPAAKVPSRAPSLARSLVTLLLAPLAPRCCCRQKLFQRGNPLQTFLAPCHRWGAALPKRGRDSCRCSRLTQMLAPSEATNAGRNSCKRKNGAVWFA